MVGIGARPCCCRSASTIMSIEDNPVRVIDAFVDELDLAALGFEGAVPADDGTPRLSSRDAAEDLPLRLSQPHPVEPAPGARDAAQHRADVADRPPDAGLQDDCRLPQGQRRRRSARSAGSSWCCAASSSCSPRPSWRSTAASSRRSTTATRTSRPRKMQAPDGADRSKHRPLPGRAWTRPTGRRARSRRRSRPG